MGWASKLQVAPEDGKGSTILRNADLVVVPQLRQTWGFFLYLGYWGIPNLTIWTWSTGSALMALDLSCSHIIGAITLANVLICVYVCLNSGPGLKYRIGYPVAQRISFGVYGGFIGVVVRVVLSVVFYGSQAWLGGQAVVLMLSGLSKSFMNMPNHFAPSAEMATRDFIGFVVFSVILAFFFFSKPERMNTLVIFAGAITALVFVAMLIICLIHNHGPGELFFEKPQTLASHKAWMWLYSMSIWYGAVLPEITNQCDFSRFASSPKRMHLGVIVSIMTTGTFVPVASLVCALANKSRYGTVHWLPTNIVLSWLNHGYSGWNRAAAVIFGFAFALSQLTFNLMGNAFAGGMNLAGLFPRYVDVKRGTIITAVVSWAAQPWTFYNSSSRFVGVMSSFGVVTTPLVALMVADYLVVRKQDIYLPDLYTSDPSGLFYFKHGFHLEAILIWLVTVAIGLPGLVTSVSDHTSVPQGLNNFFYGNIIFSFIIPFVLYILLFHFRPRGLQNVPATV